MAAETDQTLISKSGVHSDVNNLSVDTDDFTIESGVVGDTVEAVPVSVVEEDIDRRGEYYKEFLLSNGQRSVTVYPVSVHYQKNGKWEEIDNTLMTVAAKGRTVYTNTAGVWKVHLPQKITDSDGVTIEKDGYAVSFSFSGELRGILLCEYRRCTLKSNLPEKFVVWTHPHRISADGPKAMRAADL